jgi:hypothetical protein
MRDLDYRVLLGAGVILLITGWVLPLLMIMRVLESTFPLNFFSYIASFMGLMLGIVGTIFFAVGRKKRR